MSTSTKKLLKSFCRYIYYTGIGSYWNEEFYLETFSYRLYTILSFTVYIVMIFLENIAAWSYAFPNVEKNSAVMFSAIHNIVLTKMFLLLHHKRSIRKLNFEMASVGANMEEKAVMNKQYRKVKYGLLLYVLSVYLSLLAYGVESLRKYFIEGNDKNEDIPFYTVVTYWPKYDDTSTFAFVLRVFFYITWLYMMLPMMSVDCLPIAHLITISFKFITLRNYLKKSSAHFRRSLATMRPKTAIARLKFDYLQGIKMHQKLLLLADDINRIFGIIMSLQVCESSVVAVLLLLRLALSPNVNITNAVMTYTFVASLFILLALNLWNAGEITYQASLLSFEIYSCGWELCETDRTLRRDIRNLVLISSAQAQKPLILKAFGIQDLSYGTFVSVARMTYSIFAVFYHRTKTSES